MPDISEMVSPSRRCRAVPETFPAWIFTCARVQRPGLKRAYLDGKDAGRAAALAPFDRVIQSLRSYVACSHVALQGITDPDRRHGLELERHAFEQALRLVEEAMRGA